MCQKSGFAPKVAGEADVMHTLFTLVAAGQGVALVPACVMSQRPEGVRFIRLQQDDYKAELVLAWRKDSPSSTLPSFVRLMEQTRKEIARDARQQLEASCSAASS